MNVKPYPNINGSKILVTGTATSLYDLIKTAASVTTILEAKEQALDALDIVAEDGSVNLTWDGTTPTSTKGQTLTQGLPYFFRGADLAKLKLIGTSGSVNCSITYGYSN